MLEMDVRVSGMWLKMPAIFQVILYGVQSLILNYGCTFIVYYNIAVVTKLSR